MAVAVTADAVDVYPPRVNVTVTGLTVHDAVEIHRVVGGIRTMLRGGFDYDVSDTSLVRVDAELPFGVPVTYHAIVNNVGFDSTPTTYTLPDTKTVLSDALTGLSAGVVISSWDEKKYTMQSSTFKVGGRNVVISGPMGQFEATIELFTETTSQWESLFQLLSNATEGLVQMRQQGGYDGVDSYVAPVGVTVRRFSQDGSDQRRVTVVQVAEVEAWSSLLEALGFTLQDIADTYDGQTLEDLSDDYATLLELAQGEFGV